MKRTIFLKVILLLIIFLTPLLTPFADFGYEQVKVLFFIFMITLAGFIWISLGKNLIKLTKIKIAGICFILALLVTSLTGLNSQVSILGTEPYYQGWILYVYLLLFALMISSVKIKMEYWAAVLMGAAFLVALFAIKDWVLLNFFHQDIPTYAGRVVSTFGQPNFYAGFLLLSLPFCWGRLGRWGILGVLGIIGGILVSGSRTAIILLPFLLLSLIIRKKKILFLGFLIGLLIFLKFFSGLIYQEIIDPQKVGKMVMTNNFDNSVEKRYYFWPLLWKIIEEKPFLGYGLENIYSAYAYYFEINKHILFELNPNQSSVMYRLRDLGINRSHNYALDLLLFSGILGFLSWGFLVCLMIKKAKSRELLVGL
ncbi:MAG: O-antigen ligase family protein, partial [Candidatus Daviesbacteria bacterium]|nr:O-antigen ligase family protein [Candidatus Daviesbacteria bacterium]